MVRGGIIANYKSHSQTQVLGLGLTGVEWWNCCVHFVQLHYLQVARRRSECKFWYKRAIKQFTQLQ